MILCSSLLFESKILSGFLEYRCLLISDNSSIWPDKYSFNILEYFFFVSLEPTLLITNSKFSTPSILKIL